MISGISNNPGMTTGTKAGSGPEPEVRQARKVAHREKAESHKLAYRMEILSAHAYSGTTKAGSRPYSEATDLNTLVANLLARQGVTREEALAGKTVAVDQQTRDEAAALIEDNGYWGVEKTSSRIFKFAIQYAGHDPGKLDHIKGAVEEGFKMALSTFGGTLPEISYKTFDSVMKKLDQWAEDHSKENTEHKAG